MFSVASVFSSSSTSTVIVSSSSGSSSGSFSAIMFSVVLVLSSSGLSNLKWLAYSSRSSLDMPFHSSAVNVLYTFPRHSKAPPGPTSLRAASKASLNDISSLIFSAISTSPSFQVTLFCPSVISLELKSMASASIAAKAPNPPISIPVPIEAAFPFRDAFLFSLFVSSTVGVLGLFLGSLESFFTLSYFVLS